MRSLIGLPALVVALAVLPVRQPSDLLGAIRPGSRVLLDAHNAYPYQGRWADRIDRALGTGLPIAIEQDLVWLNGRSAVSHGEPFDGREPTLDEHFFERIRPLVESALRERRRETWPVITLNLDFKSDLPEHHRAVWELLGRYEAWLTTAARTGSAHDISALVVGPLLVLTGDSTIQERSFHDSVPVGGKLRLFGAAPRDATRPRRTNYRRWINYPWKAVEPEGQPLAGDWSTDDAARLKGLVSSAHAAGLWIRFYTLNGHDPADRSGGWSEGYNFGSLTAARIRWDAAVEAGVDFVAVDQYEAFAAARSRRAVVLEGQLTHKDYERILTRDFDVPAGTRQLSISIEYDAARRTVIDLGLEGPLGFRGWSGGGPQTIAIDEHTASFGYTPGRLEPGRWKVLLGVPNIRGGVTTQYRVRIDFDHPSFPAAVRREPGWFAGDLHAHSGHSDGRTVSADGVRLKVPSHHVFEAARRAGLDFVALTDHNTASHWTDIVRLQPTYPDLLLLRGREVTTYRGHMNAIGERHFTDFRIGPERPVGHLAGELARSGAFVSINHPDAPDDETCMGCGWNDRDDRTVAAVHGVEVVNGDDTSGPRAGWPFWASMLTRGFRLTAIGGSDEHTPDETIDRALGRPTTVVFARELSERGIVDGLRSGRVYIRTRGADGPVLDWHVRAADGTTVEAGATVPPGPVVLSARVRRADGQQLEWIRSGQVIGTATMTGETVTFGVNTSPGDWLALRIRDASGPTLLSNAVYVAGRDPAGGRD